MLKVEQLAVGYPKKIVLDGIAFSVQQGEIVTLIGPNGAGKSTILKTIATQLSQVFGTIYLQRKNLKEYSGSDLAKTMSLLMTEKLSAEMLTCREVVAMGRYPYTGRLGVLTAADNAKVEDAMDKLHVSEFEDQEFYTLSDGQKQRVLLAKAICQEPNLIVLDEPTSYLDIQHKLEILSVLKRLVKEEHLTVIMSLHEVELAQKISDHILCVGNGKLQKYGTPEEIFRENIISELYRLTSGSYHEVLGFSELEAVKGTPEVFVIAGGGSGIPVFRKLQRLGIPFATGVLQENDIDMAVAKMLASKVISVPAFERISKEALEEAATIMENCPKVICAVKKYGEMNKENAILEEISGKNAKIWNF